MALGEQGGGTLTTTEGGKTITIVGGRGPLQEAHSAEFTQAAAREAGVPQGVSAQQFAPQVSQGAPDILGAQGAGTLLTAGGQLIPGGRGPMPSAHAPRFLEQAAYEAAQFPAGQRPQIIATGQIDKPFLAAGGGVPYIEREGSIYVSPADIPKLPSQIEGMPVRGGNLTNMTATQNVPFIWASPNEVLVPKEYRESLGEGQVVEMDGRKIAIRFGTLSQQDRLIADTLQFTPAVGTITTTTTETITPARQPSGFAGAIAGAAKWGAEHAPTLVPSLHEPQAVTRTTIGRETMQGPTVVPSLHAPPTTQEKQIIDTGASLRGWKVQGLWAGGTPEVEVPYSAKYKQEFGIPLEKFKENMITAGPLLMEAGAKLSESMTPSVLKPKEGTGILHAGLEAGKGFVGIIPQSPGIIISMAGAATMGVGMLAAGDIGGVARGVASVPKVIFTQAVKSPYSFGGVAGSILAPSIAARGIASIKSTIKPTIAESVGLAKTDVAWKTGEYVGPLGKGVQIGGGTTAVGTVKAGSTTGVFRVQEYVRSVVTKEAKEVPVPGQPLKIQVFGMSRGGMETSLPGLRGQTLRLGAVANLETTRLWGLLPPKKTSIAISQEGYSMGTLVKEGATKAIAKMETGTSTMESASLSKELSKTFTPYTAPIQTAPSALGKLTTSVEITGATRVAQKPLKLVGEIGRGAGVVKVLKGAEPVTGTFKLKGQVVDWLAQKPKMEPMTSMGPMIKQLTGPKPPTTALAKKGGILQDLAKAWKQEAEIKAAKTTRPTITDILKAKQIETATTQVTGHIATIQKAAVKLETAATSQKYAVVATGVSMMGKGSAGGLLPSRLEKMPQKENLFPKSKITDIFGQGTEQQKAQGKTSTILKQLKKQIQTKQKINQLQIPEVAKTKTERATVLTIPSIGITTAQTTRQIIKTDFVITPGQIITKGPGKPHIDIPPPPPPPPSFWARPPSERKPAMPSIAGFGLGLKFPKATLKQKEKIPIADWLAKAKTQARGFPGVTPGPKAAKAAFFKTGGLRVPTVEMLRGKLKLGGI